MGKMCRHTSHSDGSHPPGCCCCSASWLPSGLHNTKKRKKKSPESCWCVRTVMKTKEHISSRTPPPFTPARGARQPGRWAACSPTCFQVQGDPGLVDVRRVALGADPPDRSAVHLFLRGRRHVRPAGAASTGGAAGTARDSAPQRPLVHPPGQTV